MDRREACEKVIELSYGDRHDTYGDFRKDMAAFYRKVYQYICNAHTKYSEAHNGAMICAILKMNRIEHGQYHEDNYIDDMAYVAGANEFESEERERDGQLKT